MGAFPDTPASTVETGAVVSPPLQGSVYGGHAPLVGAQVYVLSPNTSTLYGQAFSLMDGDSQNSGLTASGTGNGAVSSGGTNGYHYVTTDANGAYNLSGDYACTVDQAVYLVAVGGSPTFPSGSNTFQVNQIVVSNLSGSGVNETATYTMTTTTTENFYIGEQVNLSAFTGNFQYLPTSETVTATSLTTTTFSFTAIDNAGGIAAGTYTNTGTVTALPTANPAAINMTALGLCPSSGSFAGHISYIYTNEVSTAAMAVATAAFGSGPFNIGVATGGTVDSHYASYDKNGLKQALNNAGLLYDITGSNLSTTYAGEGHIARSVTPAGNGIVPQALMDTWGNILAACVDSNNTGTGTSASPQCVSLFETATNTGIVCTSSSGTITCPSGTTAPTDIATAAFNIAHFPAGTATTVGTNPAFVNTLYTLPTGNLPFAPNLVSNGAGQPNDFSVAIAFVAPSASGSNTNYINQPQVISINGGNFVGNESNYTSDAAGELQESVWIGSYYGPTVKLFANGGAPDYTTNTALNNFGTQNSRSVTIDAAQNVWMVFQQAAEVQEFTVNGAGIQTFATTSGNKDYLALPEDASIDGVGTSYNLYVNGYTSNFLLKLAVVNGTSKSVVNTPGSGTDTTQPFSDSTANTGSGTAACIATNTSLAFTPSGTLFVGAANGQETPGVGAQCVINTSTGAQVGTAGTGFEYQSSGQGPATSAVDSNGVSWVGGGMNTSNVSQGIWSYTSGGTATQYTGGGTSEPCGVAIDGANSIWVGNGGTYSVSHFSNAGVALSPVANTGSNANAVGGLNPQINSNLSYNGNTVFHPGTSTSNCGSPAIDRAGDIWVAYQGNSYSSRVIFEILGIAAPVVTPRSYATFGNGTTGYLGTRPY